MALDLVSGARVLCICNNHPVAGTDKCKIQNTPDLKPDSSAVSKRLAASGSDPKSGLLFWLGCFFAAYTPNRQLQKIDERFPSLGGGNEAFRSASDQKNTPPKNVHSAALSG